MISHIYDENDFTETRKSASLFRLCNVHIQRLRVIILWRVNNPSDDSGRWLPNGGFKDHFVIRNNMLIIYGFYRFIMAFIAVGILIEDVKRLSLWFIIRDILQ